MAEQDSDAQKKLAKDLWKAVDNNDVTKVRFLLGQGADPNHKLYWSDEWAYKLPPLHEACRWGHLEIVKTLVTHGARTDEAGGWLNLIPFHWACWGGNKEVVKYFFRELGLSTDVRDKDNKTPLHWACEGGSIDVVDVVQYLVEEKKMDVDVRDDEGKSPLDKAMAPECLYKNEGCVDVALYLNSRGCACGDEDKAKLLCAACDHGNLGVVKELVELHKLDPKNVRDDEGQSPLDKALKDLYECGDGCVDVALYLMSRGCGGDEDKAKLLCPACFHGNLGVVKELVEQHKVDPKNVRDDYYNWTPLQKACWKGHKDVVQYLVEKANCDISVTDDDDETPLDLATQYGHTEIAVYLKSLPQQSAVTGDTDSRSVENGPPPTEKQKVTSDPLSGQQTPNAGNEQPETTDMPNGSKQLPPTSKEGPNLTSSTSSKERCVAKKQ